jgi:hypothetical protein
MIFFNHVLTIIPKINPTIIPPNDILTVSITNYVAVVVCPFATARNT